MGLAQRPEVPPEPQGRVAARPRPPHPRTTCPCGSHQRGLLSNVTKWHLSASFRHWTVGPRGLTFLCLGTLSRSKEARGGDTAVHPPGATCLGSGDRHQRPAPPPAQPRPESGPQQSDRGFSLSATRGWETGSGERCGRGRTSARWRGSHSLPRSQWLPSLSSSLSLYWVCVWGGW